MDIYEALGIEIDSAKARASEEAVQTIDHLFQDIPRMRQEAGLSQNELAELIGTTQACISRWENARDIKLSTLARIAVALEMRLEIRMTPVLQSHCSYETTLDYKTDDGAPKGFTLRNERLNDAKL